MSLHLDYAELSRQARRIVDANRARSVLQAQQEAEATDDANGGPRKKVKFSRSTKGCLPCRSHKVKCDETTPTCLRCVASQRECEYPAPRQGNEKKRNSQGRSKSISAPDSLQNGSDGVSSSNTPVLGGFLNGASAEAGPSRLGHLSAANTMASLGMDGLGGNMMGNGNFTLSLPKVEKPSPKQLSPSEIFNITPVTHQSASPNGPTYSSPDMSFLNDLIPDFNITGFSPPDPFFPNTSPTSTLPVNWAPPASMPQPAPNLPQIANLTKSALLTRRVGKGKESGGIESNRLTGTPTTTMPPRLAVVESILHACQYDEAMFEFGPSHRQRTLSSSGISSSGITTSTDVLSNAFPSPIARTLFHHYCNVTSRILITMGNIGPNPLLAICTPLRLLDTNSAASAAMRMSMLSTSVAHFGHETEQHIDPATLPPAWADQKAQLKAMSSKFKKAALSNILLSSSSDGGTAQTDSLLAACALLCIRDVVTADPTWRDNMDFVLNLISKKGGPQAMLKPADYSFTRRYLLENLAAHDVFSYFTTGKEPQLLGNYDSWWFDSVETSQTRWEWESVERSFGVSRAMVDLVARICVLDSHKTRLGISLKGHPDELWDAGQHFIRESHCLLLELDIWGNSLNALPQHFRVTCGDYIYKYMAVIYILGEILEQDVSTPRIVSAVNHVLELCSEADAFRLNVMLIWPLLIAGQFCLLETREKVRSLFDAFQSDYGEDLVVARELLEEQWRGVDTGIGRRRWTAIMKKLDKPVLLI